MELNIKYFENSKEDNLSKLKCRLIDVCQRYMAGETIIDMPEPKTEQEKKRYEILKKYVDEFEDKKESNK